MSDPTAPNPALLLIDRTAVLFCGVAAGVAIGLAFAPQLSAWIAEGPPVTVAAAAPAQAVDVDGLPQAVAAAADVPAGLARAVAEQRAFRIGHRAAWLVFDAREQFKCCGIVGARRDANNALAGGGQHGFRFQHHLRAIRHAKALQARKRE